MTENLFWLALRVEPRSEFAVESHLRKCGYQAICPTETKVKRVSRYSKKTRKATYPLFPGYVFFGTDGRCPNWDEPLYLTAGDRSEREDIRHYAKRSGRVWRVLSRDGVPYVLSSRELNDVCAQARVSTPNRQSVNTHKAIRQGDEVSVIDGPWKGWTVKAKAIASEKIRTVVNLLGKDHEIDIPFSHCEAA